MADTLDKVYVTDGSNAFANGMATANMMNGGNNLAPWMAMANNGGFGNNGAWNNPFIYLVWMMFANNWMGNNGNNPTTQGQIAALQNQIQDNHNSDLLMGALQGNKDAIQGIANVMNADFNQVNAALCNINSSLQRELAATNGNVNLASERILNGISQQTGILGSQIQNTGCGIKTSILESGYQNQINNLNQTNQLSNSIQSVFNSLNTTLLNQGYQNQLANCQQTNGMLQGFNSLTNTVQNGFTSIGYQLNTIGCDIKQNSTNNTQKIIDYLVGTKQLDQATTIQQLRDEIGRLQQTNTILSELRNNTTTPTTGA